MDPVRLQPAYLLHRRDYRNSSLLLEVLSADFGRWALVARGARRGTRAALLQPFQPLSMSWSARGELGTLTDVEAAGSALPLHGRTLVCGFYLNELVLRLTPRQDAQPEVFACYGESLRALAACDDPEPVLREFELALLGAIGYGLQLAQEADGRTPVDPQRRYRYLTDGGPHPVGDAEAGAPAPVSGRSLLAMARGDWEDPQTLADARRLLRGRLDELLGARPLHSRVLYQAILKREKPGC